MDHRAQCHCGQLSATCTGEPARNSVCHCLTCKQRSGSAFSWNATYRADQVTIAGNYNSYRRTNEEGRQSVHNFCPHCGSTVFYAIELRPGMISIPAGAFADPHFPAPHVEVYAERGVGWCTVTGVAQE